MKIAITGSRGFLGWHTAVRLRAEHGVDPVRLGREDFATTESLLMALGDADTLIHAAGVNRAETAEEVESGNVDIASMLAEAIVRSGRPVHLVYANSIQSELDNPYGRGKCRAGEILEAAARKVAGTFVDVCLPNLFGEHGRPHYNSFVATFCDELAKGGDPTITNDKRVPLLHVQRASAGLVAAAYRREDHRPELEVEERLVSDVLGMLREFHEKYAQGQVPALGDAFTIDLFNTYRSYVFPQYFPFRVKVNSDKRGQLFETVRQHGGTGQTFVSTTGPGETRGDHFHLSKVERFFVLQGTAEIALRRVYDDEIIRFRVTGGDRAYVDMPTMWVHNITNIGDEELVTMFWTDQLLNPAAPDTYWESVEPEKKARS